ncbi:MAG: adenylate/guanylate cyclase domain-containing protein [Verrucomicrobiales bacterium]|nr:adenylate/guanylate cyclase domain-containing protein [Verrucomicrobiales bacterium]
MNPPRPAPASASPAAPDPAVDDPFSITVDRSRQENAAFMGQVRFALATAFLLFYGLAITALGEEDLRLTVGHMILYWLIATALLIFGRRNRLFREIGRFAVPLIDMPMVTWIQTTTVSHSERSQTVALFTLALLLFLIVLSSFSLRARHLLLSGAVGIACLAVVYRAAGLSPVSWVAGPLLLAVTATMMSWLPRRQTLLIRETAERQARRDRLARYFSPGVAEVIESHDTPATGESCEITVLFCDIRGFTTLSENLDATEVVRLLNDFHGHMVDEIFRYGGTLDKYLGDGLLAYFNAPVRQSDHAGRAVECALAMVDRLEVLNRDRASRGEPPLRIGIGIHSGTAVVGNIGAANRREFTAIGDTVNVASRLQSLTRDRGVSILASDSTEAAAAIGESRPTPLLFTSAGRVEVRGRSQGLEVFVPSRG